MNLGAEPKKVAILGGLIVLAGIVYFMSSGSSEPAPAPRRAPALNASPSGAVPTARAATRRRGSSSSLGEFKPILRSPNPQDRPDPATIDPQIRFDLLAKLEGVQVNSSGRNIFQMGAAPAPVAPPGPLKPLPTNPGTIAVNHPPTPAVAGPPPAPPAPPITFHYYGFKVSKANGRREAFLLDGEDIMIAGENDSVKKGRYKITHIGVNSITIEDTQFKHSQTLQLEEVRG
jgi:hypothetical protein